MEVGTQARVGGREIARLAVRARLSDALVHLCDEDSFDEISIDQIAAVAGVSTRTFYRHFDSKEGVVLALFDDPGPAFRARLRDRPTEEPIWEALRRAFDPVTQPDLDIASHMLFAANLASDSPTLLARTRERSFVWEELMAEVIADRLDVPRRQAPDADVLATCALSALRTAFTRWHAGDDHSLEALERDLDAAFGSVARHLADPVGQN